MSLPWWLYSLIGFGSLMPSSGAAQVGPFALWRVAALGQALLQVAVPFIQIRWIQGPLQTLAQAAVAAVVGWLFVARVLPRAKGTDTVHAGGVLALSTLLLGLYYVGFTAAAHFYGRYLAPLMLVSIPMTALALVEVRRCRAVLQEAAAIALVSMAAVSAIAWDIQASVLPSGYYHEQLRLIEDHVPPTDAVSAFQSGTIGYFRDRVVNLDGKVNGETLRRRERSPGVRRGATRELVLRLGRPVRGPRLATGGLAPGGHTRRVHPLPEGEFCLRIDALSSSARPIRWRRDPAGIITPGVIIGVRVR